MHQEGFEPTAGRYKSNYRKRTARVTTTPLMRRDVDALTRGYSVTWELGRGRYEGADAVERRGMS